MHFKKIAAAALAAALTTTSALAVHAADIELTPANQSGETEVIARIEGSSTPGNVDYIITIPDVVDFGVLQQPSTDQNDSYKLVNFDVEATKIDGLDKDNEQISIYVRDEFSTPNTGEDDFTIANKQNSSIKFKYDVFDEEYDPANIPANFDEEVNRNIMTYTHGYYFTNFTVQGQTLTGTLRLNQVQLYGKALADIAGDYSGHMVFYSIIENQSQNP